jgi:hypothetical protein
MNTSIHETRLWYAEFLETLVQLFLLHVCVLHTKYVQKVRKILTDRWQHCEIFWITEAYMYMEERSDTLNTISIHRLKKLVAI